MQDVTKGAPTREPKQHGLVFHKDEAWRFVSGGKTQFRRPVASAEGVARVALPVGAVVWVREEWSPDGTSVYPCPPVWYRADFEGDDPVRASALPNGEPRSVPLCRHAGACGTRAGDCLTCYAYEHSFRWRPALTMPPRHARTRFTIVAVRTERLQDISPEDAFREGVWAAVRAQRDRATIPEARAREGETAQSIFRWRWEAQYRTGPNAWSANPEVFVYDVKGISR